MPIQVSVNTELALQLIRFSGRVSFPEAAALYRFHETCRPIAAADSVQVIEDDADLSDLAGGSLRELRERFNALHRALDLMVLRRSGWICRSASAWGLVERWLDGRHSHDGQGAEVCLVADTSDLALLFSDDEIAAIASERGFIEFARFECPATELV